MEKGNILIFGLVVLFMVYSVWAKYEEDMEEQLRHADANENAGMYDAAASSYGMAALDADMDKDYDLAIKYELKSIEMWEKAGMRTGLSHVIVAKYYSKKGAGFEDEIKAQCSIAEEKLLAEIEVELKRDDMMYSSISLDYSNIAQCYKYANDSVRACNYCIKSNEYLAKDNEGPHNCEYYLCPKSPKTPTDASGTDVSGGTAGGLPLLPIAVGIIVLILVAGLFLLKGKKRKSK